MRSQFCAIRTCSTEVFRMDPRVISERLYFSFALPHVYRMAVEFPDGISSAVFSECELLEYFMKFLT